jgi:hypothetical protein
MCDKQGGIDPQEWKSFNDTTIYKDDLAFKGSVKHLRERCVSHLIVNRTLKTVHLVVNSSDEFLAFSKGIMDLFEYKYEVKEFVWDFKYLKMVGLSELSKQWKNDIGSKLNYDHYESRSSWFDDTYRTYVEHYCEWELSKSFMGRYRDSKDEAPKNPMIKESSPLSPLEIGGYDPSIYLDSSLTASLYGSTALPSRSDTRIPTIVLFGKEENVTCVLQEGECQWAEQWIGVFPSWSIVIRYEGLYRVASDSLREYFHMRTFEGIEQAQENVKSYDSLYQLSKEVDAIEAAIESYFMETHEISEDPRKMMRASVLQERIETGLLSLAYGDISSRSLIETAIRDSIKFRKTLSTVLLNMGLNKKRLSDGIYYYGIEPREVKQNDTVAEWEKQMLDRGWSGRAGASLP